MREIKPVRQTDPEDIENALAACLATLLKKEISEVPRYTNKNEWWSEIQSWLKTLNHYMIAVIEQPDRPVMFSIPDGIHCILVGESPRIEGITHFVIGKSNYFAHDENPWVNVFDPHPSGDFLKGKETRIIFLGSLE